MNILQLAKINHILFLINTKMTEYLNKPVVQLFKKIFDFQLRILIKSTLYIHTVLTSDNFIYIV